MKLGFQRKSSKAPQTRKKNTNSKHYFEEQNTNASIGNNKVTKLFMSNDILQLKKGLNSLNTFLYVPGRGMARYVVSWTAQGRQTCWLHITGKKRKKIWALNQLLPMQHDQMNPWTTVSMRKTPATQWSMADSETYVF